jgi:histidine triad (HIT) family protein
MPDADPTCIFCRIVAGEIPASIVHRGATATAFLDIRPVTPGHLLVVPNRHHARLADTPVETWAHVMRIARRLAGALRASGLPADGINLWVADGEVAGQEVAHLHVHVIPRTTGDGFGVDAQAWQAPPPSRAELDRQAAAVRVSLGADR